MANLPTDNAAARPPSGQPKDSKEPASGRSRLRPKPWWLIFVVFMMANYLVTRVLFPEPPWITVPYTFFKKQVVAGNVEGVTSLGDSIEGRFKTDVTYPPEMSQAPDVGAPASPSADQPKPRTAKRFRTQRPAFADTGLETLLEEKGATIGALDESAAECVQPSPSC
jgi:cell division protease FtsH